MNDKLISYILIPVEILLFCLIAVFCFGSLLTKPERVFSLQQSFHEPNPHFHTNAEEIAVKVPHTFSSYFNADQIQSLRLVNANQAWSSNALPETTLQIALSDIIGNHQNSYGLFFYLISLQPADASYDIRVLDSQSRVQNQTSSGLLPAGEMIWRDSFGSVDVLGTTLQVTLDSPESKVFLCDFFLYDAPGLKYWDLGAE